MKSIALIDTLWDGHHSSYLKIFSKVALELGYQVTAFCPSPDEVRKWITLNCPEQVYLFHAFELREPEQSLFPVKQFRQMFTTFARWQSTANAIRHASAKIGKTPDLVFFPYVDSYLGAYLTRHIIEQLFPYNWVGMYLQPRHLRIPQRFPYIRWGPLNPNEILKSYRCQAVAVLDEGIAEKLQSQINGKPVFVFPDFADESPPDPNFSIAQQIREKAGERKIVGLLGPQGKRKGFLTLLEATQKVVKENYFFVFAGRLAEDSFLPHELAKIRHFVASEPTNCFFHFKTIPDEPQFNTLVNLCDVLFVAYENYPFSSNLLTKAAIFEKPVIGSNTFCIGERIKKFRLGTSIPEADVSACIEAIQTLIGESKITAQQIQPDFEGYRNTHCIKKLSSVFQTLLT